MGDETTQFALRFSSAVKQLAVLAGDPSGRAGAGASSVAAVRNALAAVEAVYQTGTNAVRDWPEQRRRVLEQIARVREVLDRSGVGADVRRVARELVDAIEPRRKGGSMPRR